MKVNFTLLICLCFQIYLPAQSAPTISPQNLSNEDAHQCISRDFRELLTTPTWVDEAFVPSNNRDFPTMGWPLGKPLYDDLFLMNYYDESNPGMVDNQFTDYECGHLLGYDGHTGTDITVFNFRLMDKGMPIFAAADGVVAAAVWDIYDRNYGPPYPTTGANIVRILHDNGTQSAYVHLRKNSVAVNIGDPVVKGQFLGFVGSSGWTPIPHLHIEFWEEGSTTFGNAATRDPWDGSCSMVSSLWDNQEAYVPNNDIWVMDMGITTVDAVGGDLANLTIIPFKDRAEEPIVYGSEDETTLLAWIQLQAPVGDNYRIDIHHPNGDLIETSGLQFISNYIRYWWHPYGWDLTEFEPSDWGTWTMKVYTNGELLKEHPFEIGEKTYYKPRFYPLNGKSFRMTDQAQKDTLQLWEFSASANFHLINAPNYVTLEEGIVTIAPSEEQPYRSLEFQVVGTDDLGLTDTMWYHIVDPNKPVEMTTDIFDIDQPTDFQLISLSPNPGRGDVQLIYNLKKQQEISVEIFKVNGQKIATVLKNSLTKAGNHSFSFNTELLNLKAGVYFLKLGNVEEMVVEKLVVF